MSADRGWADGTFAGIYSAVTLTAAFTLPLIGAQIDRFRIRYVSTTAAVCIIIGLLLLGSTASLPLIVLGLFLVRLCGQSVLILIGSTTVGRYFQGNRGRALSVSMIGLSAAEVLLPPVVAYLIVRMGYQQVWLLAAAGVTLIFLPAVWLLIRRHDNFQRADTVAAEQRERQPTVEGEHSWSRSEVLRDPRFRMIVPIALFLPFVFTGLVFNQAILAGARGYTAEWMALGLSAYGAARTVSLLLSGYVADRVGPDRLLRFVLFPVVAGLLLLLLVEDKWSVPVFFALAGLTAGLDAVVMPALWAMRYGPRFLGSIKSTVRLFVVVASAAAPVIFSFGLLRLGVETWLAVILGYALLCVGLARRERRAGLPPP